MKRKPWERPRSAKTQPCDEPGCLNPWVMRWQENHGPWRRLCEMHVREMLAKDKTS